ncbi:MULTISPECIES: MarR family winged helix-turn-helix transcriptional regulator [Paenibacillus]|jgi:DNA-binding MarR family transcriptional regulator|uniref:DNA-binding MarR family transcriptional regulator n=2 Tax=Paenibacillus TaxID=44249 RepID=A0A855XPD5_9BACL|nr:MULTISPECIES: MarR family winged helix-turn-helix transcriptional regulator [Paenibacillus]MEC0105869.1 MarR family winged helix-turn-helix transcriptional regulator [Paenibacillus taichungensis]MEC0125022.1 MarR family winged helix-turn-helix transcriptional regulator [Paenibacillus pabuli]MEC0196558.1 MarR family winged helix-turn-helix transcriptional regulator [Paenibacillus taichungensis]OAX48952.1 HTH-type transcriptional regulator MhqR [Paenibacillus sp. AD87]PWW33514.1 DNA-binding M
MLTEMRRFNRFYTNILGVLDKHILGTGYSFAEARVIIEIGIQGESIANNLVDTLTIDRSYMSRIVSKLTREGLLMKVDSAADSRVSLIRLTEKGQELYGELNERSDQQIVKLMQGLDEEEIREVYASMMNIQDKLNKRAGETRR